jgi:hypothetical protein
MRLTKSFSTGKSASGLVGTQILDFIYVTDSYWDTESSGTNTSAAGVGRTTTEMKDISTYQGWDFDNIWYMPPDGYPMLRWQLGMPCTPNILNTTPTEWINISRCYENGSRIQQRRVTQYDANGCVENQTLYEYRKASEICWACFPLITNTTWGSWTNATACSNGNLTQSRNMTVYDANACGTGNTTLFDYRNASCVLCGNGMIDAGEECDGSNITATCQSLGYAGGSLACHDNCTHNTTSCTTTPSQPPSGGGGGGGGGAPATKPKTTTPAQPPEQTPPETPQQPSGQSDMQRTYVVDNQRLAEGYSQALSVDDTVKFDATGEGTMHQLTVKEVTNDSATMIIQSEPVEFTLRKGEARAFDFDNDTHSEILVILDDIINGRAMIKIAYIAAAAPGQPLAGGIMLIAVAAVVIIAAGIALVAVAYIVSRKGPRGVGHLPSAGKSGKSDGSRTKIKGMISEGCRMIDAGEFASATRVYGRIKSEYESSGISDKRLYGEIMEFYGELTEATKGKE